MIEKIMTLPAIKINSINKGFGTGRKHNSVLHHLTLTVAQGEVFGFLGPNGAGKSTTIKLLMNFLHPDKGDITILGNRVGKEEFRKEIGYLSEFPFFYEHLTAHETLMISGRLSGDSKEDLLGRIPKLLAKMNLSDAVQQRVSGFSKGMKQRLGMATALIHNPKILILDEPMSGLDPLGRHLMKSIILELKKEGKTIFFSSHILSDIKELCDRIGIIHKGHLLYCGNLTDFLSDEQDMEESFVSLISEADDAAVY